MIKQIIRSLAEKILSNPPKDFKSIPIIINNYNRLTTLKQLITDLESRGYNNIHIIDNKSTYSPLLDFYKQSKHKIYLLNKNLGYKSLWKSGIWHKFKYNYFVYTDSDINLISECPKDFMKHFYDILQKYPKSYKVGFSIKIDDLPDHYVFKKKVIDWEKNFYFKSKEKHLYIAPIDTTFALYRPFSRKGKTDGSNEMYRTGFPYQIRHMPWYSDSNNLTDEEQYYISSTNQSNWAIAKNN